MSRMLVLGPADVWNSGRWSRDVCNCDAWGQDPPGHLAN